MLVTIDYYRYATGDLYTADATCASALVEAQELLEDALDRQLESAERTETLQIRQRGYVYPHALPITVISATSAATGDLLSGGFALRLTSSPAEFVDLLPIAGHYGDELVREVDVTYTGGYTVSNLPVALRRAIAKLARALVLAPARGGSGPRPAGATSVSLGDASVVFGKTSREPDAVDELVPGLFRTVADYLHLEAR